MPTFNHEAYVAGAVESVWRQTYRPLELIAVDDGSSDRTPQILTEMAARSPIPMSVRHIPNRGIAGALNVALEQAAGEWMSVLASDDAYDENKIATQLNAVAARPQSVAVHSDYLCVGPDGDPSRVHQGGRLPPARGSCHRDLLRGRATVNSVTMMIRTDVLCALGGWDERYAQEDWPLILRLARAGEIAYCAKALVCRRVHPGNVSSLMSRRRPFTPDDAAVDLLREHCESRRDFEICAAVHVAVVMRNSIAELGWRRSREAFSWTWRECPTRRRYLLGQVASGLRSLVWLRILRPLLPRGLAARISGRRSTRLAARLARGTEPGATP